MTTITLADFFPVANVAPKPTSYIGFLYKDLYSYMVRQYLNRNDKFALEMACMEEGRNPTATELREAEECSVLDRLDDEWYWRNDAGEDDDDFSIYVDDMQNSYEWIVDVDDY